MLIVNIIALVLFVLLLLGVIRIFRIIINKKSELYHKWVEVSPTAIIVLKYTLPMAMLVFLFQIIVAIVRIIYL